MSRNLGGSDSLEATAYHFPLRGVGQFKVLCGSKDSCPRANPLTHGTVQNQPATAPLHRPTDAGTPSCCLRPGPQPQCINHPPSFGGMELLESGKGCAGSSITKERSHISQPWLNPKMLHTAKEKATWTPHSLKHLDVKACENGGAPDIIARIDARHRRVFVSTGPPF